MTKIISEYEFDDAATLHSCLTDIMHDAPRKTIIYIQGGPDGAIFTKVKLVKETLTDGSHVYNAILEE